MPGNIKETAGIVLESGWYYCDGSNKNRITDINLFNAITIQQSGLLTSGSPVITGLSDTSNVSPGMPMSGIGVQGAAVVQSVDSATQVTMSLNATVSVTTPLVFAPYGVGDGSSTFGLPNRAYFAVGRDNASGSATNVLQVSTNLVLTGGSPSATVADGSNLFAGMFVAHPKAPIGTTITSISGNSLTLSANAIQSASSTGRFSSIKDTQTLGTTGGSISRTIALVTANLPAYTPSGSIANGAIFTGFASTAYVGTSSASSAVGSGGPVVPTAATSTIGISSSQGGSTFTGTAQGGTSAPITKGIVPPTIVMNYIIKR